LIEHINKHEGVEWVTMEQICDDFKSKNPYPAGALLPSAAGEMMSKTKEDLKPPAPEALTQLEVKP
jgi:hypothetical protein